MGDLRPIAFRVQNFRNIDDSGWIDLDRVTAFVGRNESGKTSLLQALHRFNAASGEKYTTQRDFPRDRFQSEYRDDRASTIPVCSVKFSIDGALRQQVDDLTGVAGTPATITYTRKYDHSLTFQLDPEVADRDVTSAEVKKTLDDLASATRRLEITAGGGGETSRAEILEWVATQRNGLLGGSYRNPAGVAALTAMESGVETFSNAVTAEVVEQFLESIALLRSEAGAATLSRRVETLCTANLPVFIYFENYGILDSAVYLPRFIEDLDRTPDDPRVRTINAMFAHVQLTAQDIHQLGVDALGKLGRPPTPQEIAQEQNKRELRAIRLNSASLDITEKFGVWWRQRRHQIRYQADGDYFRIWVSDDRRPGVEIELESRSKGLQWFFSFYLVFLVESDAGHKDAVLLLDEPGLNLHPTAQQELIAFFEELSAQNFLLYTTHSPFLIDAEHLTRVRTVMETAGGRCEVSSDLWPRDRDTTFPLQAALGYSMMQTLFTGKRNALVEGIADYLYIHGLSMLLRANSREGLADEIFVTPCGGTKLVGHLASLFLGQGVRPLVVLDDDEAGRARADALAKDLYRGEEESVLLVSTAVPGCAETEDVIGEEELVTSLATCGIKVTLAAADRTAGPLVNQIEAWATRTNVALPSGWKVDTARATVNRWAADPPATPELLERASAFLGAISSRV